jgi:hypothetical protein
MMSEPVETQHLIFTHLVRLREVSDSDARREVLHAASQLLVTQQPHFAIGSWAETALRLSRRMDTHLRADLYPEAATHPLLSEDDITDCVRAADEADQASLATHMHHLPARMMAAANALHATHGMIVHRLRARALQRDPGINPSWLEDRLAAARGMALNFDPDLPDDWDSAADWASTKKSNGLLTPFILPKLWRDHEMTRFYAVLSTFTGLDYLTLRHVMTAPSKQGLAIVCRAANFDRGMFEQLARLGTDGETDVDTITPHYVRVPQDVAQRVIRFHKMTEAA